MSMKNILLIFTLALLVGACCPCVETDKPQKPEQKSVAREAVEGFTGKTAVDNLKRATPKIDAANERGSQSKQEIDELTKP